MKVYLIDTNNVLDGIVVFDSERKALDYIIDKYYSSDFYKDRNSDWIDEHARDYIAEKEVR